MTWVVANHATNYVTTGSPSLHPAATIAVGSLVVVGTVELTVTASSPTVSDNKGNTYTKAQEQPVGSTQVGIISIWYSILTTALITSDTITYTPVTNVNPCGLLVLSATGNLASSPLDTAVTTAVSGDAGPVSLASGTPAVAGELFVALGGDSNFERLINVDSGNGWAAPFDNGGGSGADGTPTGVAGGGGSQVNAGTGTKTYNPTVSSGGPSWGSLIVGFKPGTATIFIPDRDDGLIARRSRRQERIAS